MFIQADTLQSLMRPEQHRPRRSFIHTPALHSHQPILDNVHPANTLRLADALIKEGKRFEMMIFPGKRHAYAEYTRYIERMMWLFFSGHLKGDYRTNTDIYNFK